MSNITRQELDDNNEALISVDPLTGEKIASADHRAANSLNTDFAVSFAPFEATVGADGKVTDSRLIKRRVGVVMSLNGIIMSNSFSKPFLSNVLEFTDPYVSLQPGTPVVITLVQI